MQRSHQRSHLFLCAPPCIREALLRPAAPDEWQAEAEWCLCGSMRDSGVLVQLSHISSGLPEAAGECALGVTLQTRDLLGMHLEHGAHKGEEGLA